MRNSVLVGRTAVSQDALATRVRAFGPQIIVMGNRVFELLAQIDIDNHTYLAITPHTTDLFVVKPHGSYCIVNHNARPAVWKVLSPNWLRADSIVQYLAERADPEQIRTCAERFAGQFYAARLHTPNREFEMRVWYLLRERRPEGAAALADALIPPRMIPPDDPRAVLADALAGLALHMIALSNN